MKAHKYRRKKTSLYIVGGVLACAVLAVGAWKIFGTNGVLNNKGPISVGASPAAAAASCSASYHDTVLCNFASKIRATPLAQTALSIHMTSTTHNKSSALTYKQDGHGNNSIIMSDNSLSAITVNGTTYVNSGGTWAQYPSKSAPAEVDPLSNLVSVSSPVVTNFHKIGTLSCGSLTCNKYTVTTTNDPNIQAYILIDTTHDQLRGYHASGEGNTIDMQISYPNVAITPPL